MNSDNPTAKHHRPRPNASSLVPTRLALADVLQTGNGDGGEAHTQRRQNGIRSAETARFFSWTFRHKEQTGRYRQSCGTVLLGRLLGGNHVLASIPAPITQGLLSERDGF